MTQEEKARAYDEALEKARKLLNMILDNELLGFPNQIREIFPQLKESENDKNERIQKFIAETVFCQYGDSQEYLDVLAYLEKQQENFKLEDSWHKVTDSFPDSTREVICKDAIGNFFIGRYYKGSNLWEISMYDDMNKSNEDNPPVVMWCDIPSEKQKERKPIKMEVYEVGKGTTVCGQDYKCKKDYKVGNCRYIKDAIYHCGRDGYLTDQNGVSWSCTQEWFEEYIQSNTEWAEEEKTRFVSGQFLQCKLSFDEFKEGERYWLEYVGDDMYVGRSDNILNQKFHITPRQLYTLFSQQLEEKQKEQKHYWKPTETDVALFNKAVTTNKALTPTERAQLDIIRSKFGHCHAVNCSGMAQKEQKLAHTAKEMWKEMRLDVYAQASGNRHEPNYSDDSTKIFSLCDIDEIFEKIGNTAVGSQPAEWSEEDEEMLDIVLTMVDCSTVVPHSGGQLHPSESYKKDISEWLKSLRPSWKPSEEQMVALEAATVRYQSTGLESLYEELKKLM